MNVLSSGAGMGMMEMCIRDRKIPMIDFASMTYLPEIRSKSKLNCVIALTKLFTLSMEFKEICTAVSYTHLSITDRVSASVKKVSRVSMADRVAICW